MRCLGQFSQARRPGGVTIVSELSDQQLLESFCAGERESFDALYRRYAARVHATAYRLTSSHEDAEDTLQDVFIALSEKARTIRHGVALSSWIYRTTVNRATDRLRRRRPSVSLDDATPQAARIVAMESLKREGERDGSDERELMLVQIEAMIPRLPRRQSAAFVLRGFQGLSHREIAAALNCSESGSKSLFSLACQKLREWFAEQEAQEAGHSTRSEAGLS